MTVLEFERTPEIASASVAGSRLEKIWETDPGIAGWLSTVDHKEIGMRYIVTALIFLLLGGLQALVMRVQLARPEPASAHAGAVQPAVHDARRDDDLSLRAADPVGVQQLFVAAHSGLARHGVPAAQRAVLLDLSRLRHLHVCRVRDRPRAKRRLVQLRALCRAPVQSRSEHRFLFFGDGFSRDLDDSRRGQLRRHLFSAAGAGDVDQPRPGHDLGHADRLCSQLTGRAERQPGVLDVVDGPAVQHAFLRRLAGRSAAAVATSVLDLRASLGLRRRLAGDGHGLGGIAGFCRRPLVGYTPVALSTVATMVLGFGVWVHHMFATGLPNLALSFFSGASIIISVPSAVAVFAWIATIWLGRPVITTAFLFFASMIVLFVIGGVSGFMTGSVPVDWQLTDTYFVVAHLHYVLIGINVFPVVGALYYWFPKMTGRMLDERLGKWNFWTMFIGFNFAFLPMHLTGLFGMPRRIYTYPAGMGWDAFNLITSIGAFVFAHRRAPAVDQHRQSLRRGRMAGANPWDAATLEWSVSSPPPPYNFAVIPRVASRYPLWEDRLRKPTAARHSARARARSWARNDRRRRRSTASPT